MINTDAYWDEEEEEDADRKLNAVYVDIARKDNTMPTDTVLLEKKMNLAPIAVLAEPKAVEPKSKKPKAAETMVVTSKNANGDAARKVVVKRVPPVNQ